MSSSGVGVAAFALYSDESDGFWCVPAAADRVSDTFRRVSRTSPLSTKAVTPDQASSMASTLKISKPDTLLSMALTEHDQQV